MQRDDVTVSESVTYVAPVLVWRAVDTFDVPLPRVVLWPVRIAVVPVPLRATTRRVDEDVGVDARAVVDVPDVARRADTLRVAVAARADVAARAADAPVVALRADVVVVARRGTTLRVEVVPFDLVRAKTLICAFEFDGVTPGFNWVRMVLFMYGYRLLYVFALT